ncbi:MAG: BatA domain-containing protein [Opitutaceae bacterium]|jgi:hypothetical protein|nr:BatA domain-containing protein [Opitutaceae bacterium]
MIPTFTNFAGFWALLGIPAVVAIHFLQQRSRTVRTSTLFLLEALAPESRGGRRFDRLRLSRAFWLQIAAVLLATWSLAQPRWVRNESAQVVVAVLDDSMSMRVFHDEAVREVDKLFSRSRGRAAHTEWVVMTSNARQPVLYRGGDRRAALSAVEAWEPSSGTHECETALRLGRTLSGASGATWFFTDRRGRAPADQPTVGVGRPAPNAGFAGARCDRNGWRALVRNYSDAPLSREWWLESGGQRSAARRIEIGPGGLVELSATFPEGADSCVLVLAGDAFASDDRLPMVRPVPKRLSVGMEMNGEGARAFFRKLAESVPGVEFAPRDSGALRLADLQDGSIAPAGAAIFVARASGGGGGGGAARGVQTAPVVAERHALTDGLNWQGLVGTGAAGLRRAEGAEVLLWQGGEALAWVSNRRLFLNFDWEAGNAARLPSMVLLIRRFIEETQAWQDSAYSANFDAGAPVRAGGGGSVAGGSVTGALVLESADGARELSGAEAAVLRAPGDAGFFTVRRGGRVLVRGAAQFADARQGDFRECARFVSGAPDAGAEREMLIRNSRGDPLANVWLVMMGAALMWSWKGREGRAGARQISNAKRPNAKKKSKGQG